MTLATLLSLKAMGSLHIGVATLGVRIKVDQPIEDAVVVAAAVGLNWNKVLVVALVVAVVTVVMDAASVFFAPNVTVASG